MKFATGLAVAGLIAFGMAGAAQAQDMMSMPQCWASCNTSYSQCLSGGTDMMMASTPQEGVNKAQMNAQNWTACNQQAFACHQSCWQ